MSAVPGYGEDDTARVHPEPPKGAGLHRAPFARDRARVLHSAALRRLAGKTQVVAAGEDDFPRTRLTHSLECAQIGREMAAALGADADLVDAACLAHDLGHPPFGHNGEAALAAAAEPCGGFEGNAQSLRLLTRLEVKVPGAGLNLTRATLDAATKYPWARRADTPKFGVYREDAEVFGWLRRGAAGQARCVEAQIMDWADDVAYSVHDLEDGVQARWIPLAAIDVDAVIDACIPAYAAEHEPVLAAWERLAGQPWWLADYDGSPGATAALKAVTSELIGRLSGAAVAATRAAAGGQPMTRYAGDLVVPAEVRAECALLKAIVALHVMGRPGAAAAQERQRALITELVEALLDHAPDALDPLLRPAWAAAADDAQRRRVVIDQVASLTDRSAVSWHRRLRAA